MKIIEKSIFRGFDWHDSFILTQYLSGKNGYDVSDEDCMDLIARDVGGMLSERNYPSWENLTANIRNGISFKDSQKYEAGHFECSFENGEVKVSTDTGGFDYDVEYFVIDIKEPRYVAVEEFYAPFKGAYTIQRTYWPPFKAYEEAERALKKTLAHPEYYRTGKLVLILDRSDFDPGKNAENWLRLNLRDVEIRKKNPNLPFSPRVFLEEEDRK